MFVLPLAILLGLPGLHALPAIGAGQEEIRARYEVDLDGRSRAIFALPPGPRTIRSFRWDPDPDAPLAWRSARVRLVWDGEDPEAAGVDLPLGLLVASSAAEPGEDEPARFINRRPMPYRRGGRLVIDAEGPVRGSIRLEAEPGAATLDDQGYLRAEVVEEGAVSEASPPAAPGEIVENGEGIEGPPVRYWYDRRPGPADDRHRH